MKVCPGHGIAKLKLTAPKLANKVKVTWENETTAIINGPESIVGNLMSTFRKKSQEVCARVAMEIWGEQVPANTRELTSPCLKDLKRFFLALEDNDQVKLWAFQMGKKWVVHVKGPNEELSDTEMRCRRKFSQEFTWKQLKDAMYTGKPQWTRSYVGRSGRK